jgi:hypothetical protein
MGEIVEIIDIVNHYMEEQGGNKWAIREK